MKEMKKKGRPLDENEKNAKMSVVKAMRDMAAEHMGEKLKGIKKVTVASNDKTGLAAGLEKAKELVAGSPDAEEESEEETTEEGIEEPSAEIAEMSEEELDEKLAELMALKKQMDAKKAGA